MGKFVIGVCLLSATARGAVVAELCRKVEWWFSGFFSTVVDDTLPDPPLIRFGRLAKQKTMQAANDRLTVDGEKAELKSEIGHVNQGILYVVGAGDRPRVIKLYSAEGRDRDFQKILFMQKVDGNYLGAELGGPRVYEFGELTDPHGKKFFYVEMEWLGFGEPTITLKAPSEKLGILEKRLRENPDLIRQAARIEVRALENGVIPEDLDFVFTADRARALDTDYWKKGTLEKASRSIQAHFTALREGYDPHYVEFVSAFREEVVRSNVLRPEQKAEVLAIVLPPQ